MKETWKDVKGYEGLYQVSGDGRVRRLPWLRCNRINYLHSTEDKRHGYCRVMLSKYGVSKRFLVHRLVAAAFIPNPDNKPCVDHINRNRSDNRVENLRWCTHKENNNFEETRKTMSIARCALFQSEYGDKLRKDARCRCNSPVVVLDADGKYVGRFISRTMAAEFTGYDMHTVSRACLGKQETKRFKFIDEQVYNKKHKG